jgi:hypothetical protein
MKKIFCIVVLAILPLVSSTWTCQALAYTVTGDISSGWGISGGDLWYDVFKETATSSADGKSGLINNPVYGTNKYNTINHNWIEGDYVLVTGASGQALYSIGELDPRFGNGTVTVSANGSGGYDLSGIGRSVTDITNISVIHAADVWYGYASMPASTGVTITGTDSASYSIAQLAAMTPVTYTATYTNKTTDRTGPTIVDVLKAAGVDTNNMLSYVIASSTDGYKTVLSMYELTHLSENEASNYAIANGQSPHTLGVLDMLSLNESSGIRSVITADVNSGRWGKAFSTLDVHATPEPATLALMGIGALGAVIMRKRVDRIE